jgi:ParB family transcriptional regulator, chromosome partitioning protein
MSVDQPRRLGRGLEALIATAKQQRESGASREHPEPPASGLRLVPVAEIAANRFQPRRTFTEPGLTELEASIKASGLLQAITVRPKPEGGWELVAGERRLRAVSRLGWTEIPAVVRDFDDRAMLTLALVENLQRSDLNALEEAEGYQRLIDEFGLTQQQVADAVGKDRTSITNLLRVLTLPAAIQSMVERGHITAGHARALLPIKDQRRQLDLANEIVARQLSVRETEARARGQLPGNDRQTAASARGGRPAEPGDTPRDPEIRRVEERLRKHLQTDVHVQQLGGGRGVIRLGFFGPEDLERLLDLVLRQPASDFD